MKRRKINIIIGLVVFALLGILLMQFLWMRHAWIINEAEFERKVYEAMDLAVEKYQQQQRMKDIYTASSLDVLADVPDIAFLSDSVTRVFDEEFSRVVPDDDYFKNLPGAPKIIIRNDEDRYLMSGDDVDAITGCKVYLDDSLVQFTTMVFKEKMDSINLVIQKKLEGIEEHTLRLNKTMEQFKVEFKQYENADSAFFAFDGIDTLISKELSQKGIDLAFESKILKGNEPQEQQENLDAFRVSLEPDNFMFQPGYLLLRFNGKTGFVMASLFLMASASLIFSLIVILMFIITIRSLLQQKKISDVKTDFINNMTHEFKTPIATISLATDSIDNDKVIHDPERIRYFTGMIREENKRMNMRVESVLQMSLLDKKDFQIQCKRISMHDLLTKAIGQFRLQANKAGGSMKPNLKAESDEIEIDEAHFLNVLFNIFDNALKYNDKIPEILVRTQNLPNGSLEISIIDNGIGIDKDSLKHIFDKFYRKSTGDVHNVKGFGLGLSYSRALVELMGGTISVDSQPEKGSEFKIVFPLNDNQ